MIVDLALAARLEGTLADDVGAYVTAVARLDPTSGAAREPVAGGWAQATGAGRFGNRMQAAAMGMAISGSELDRAEAFYRRRGLPIEAELCPLADRSLLRTMAGRGYVPVSFRNVYAHGLGADLPPPAAVDVVVVDGEDRFAQWSDTVLVGFGYVTPADRARIGWWNRMLFGLEQATLLLAVQGGKAVGAGNVLIRGDTASLGGTTTHPEHRRQGVQAALLSARLELARRAGCSLAVVTADPGGSSARNCERAGFRLAYTNVRLRC